MNNSDNHFVIKEDWCHLCGTRKLMAFVEFGIPKNAETSVEDSDRGYFRFCEKCVGLFTYGMKTMEKVKSIVKKREELDTSKKITYYI